MEALGLLLGLASLAAGFIGSFVLLVGLINGNPGLLIQGVIFVIAAYILYLLVGKTDEKVADKKRQIAQTKNKNANNKPDTKTRTSDVTRIQEKAIFRVAGVSYSNEDGTCRQDIVRKIPIGGLVTLTRDPSNIYDTNAIKIAYRDQMIGYVPREVARDKTISKLITERNIGKVISKKSVSSGLIGLLVEVNPKESLIESTATHSSNKTTHPAPTGTRTDTPADTPTDTPKKVEEENTNSATDLKPTQEGNWTPESDIRTWEHDTTYRLWSANNEGKNVYAAVALCNGNLIERYSNISKSNSATQLKAAISSAPRKPIYSPGNYPKMGYYTEDYPWELDYYDRDDLDYGEIEYEESDDYDAEEDTRIDLGYAEEIDYENRF